MLKYLMIMVLIVLIGISTIVSAKIFSKKGKEEIGLNVKPGSTITVNSIGSNSINITVTGPGGKSKTLNCSPGNEPLLSWSCE